MKFRKKPVVIEAVQWTGHASSTIAVDMFLGIFPKQSEISGSRQEGNAKLLIPISDGVIRVSEGDWIIKGEKEGFYACKPDIFEATYEPAEGDAPIESDRDDFALRFAEWCILNNYSLHGDGTWYHLPYREFAPSLTGDQLLTIYENREK